MAPAVAGHVDVDDLSRTAARRAWHLRHGCFEVVGEDHMRLAGFRIDKTLNQEPQIGSSALRPQSEEEVARARPVERRVKSTTTMENVDCLFSRTRLALQR